jgi:prepilin peptidase CpaA
MFSYRRSNNKCGTREAGLTKHLGDVWNGVLSLSTFQPDGCTTMLETLSVSILPVLVIIAAMTDVTNYKIPNWLTGLIAALFFPMALLTGMPLMEFGWHLLAGVILFFVGYGFFALGLFGGGDAKLMAAAGLWFGTAHTLEFLMFTVLVGGLLALSVGVWSLINTYVEYRGVERLGQIFRRARPNVPYGIALCIGALLAFPNTWWMTVG